MGDSLPPPAPDTGLTGQVKAYALGPLRADLVGIANLERFANAPLRMSPQGILPAARSVVVMAICHPDACIELGGEEHPQIIGPYRVQYLMNSRLDEMSYRLALYLERQGFRAVPIVSSNIWRYKGYKELTEHFAPDLSHRHAAVAAGLADFGYSALAITPEFGARQRFVTVITDAVLDPTPLLEPGSVCDDCRWCVEHCPAEALSKEVDGLLHVDIEGKRYSYANKNLWRCAWGEHFDLDLDLPIPDQVDEEVILENVRQHGRRGGEMGCCLRYCVPEPRRYFDPAYTSAPRRRRLDPSGDEPHRGFEQKLQALAYQQGADFVTVTDRGTLRHLGIEVADHLSDGETAVTVGLRYRLPEGADTAAAARRYLLDAAAYDLARELERRGHSAVCCSEFPETTLQERLTGVEDGWRVETATVVTSAGLAPTSLRLAKPGLAPQTASQRRGRLESLAWELGADLFGVAPADRLAAVHDQVAPVFDGEELLVARDTAAPFQPYRPEVTVERARTKGPEDHLAGAASVIVVGLRLPAAAVERTALPPAEAVGPYAFAQYESVNLLRLIALRLMRRLEDEGYRAALTFDLCGTGSFIANPRGPQPDAFCNRFAAVAAGLGRIGRGGFVLTERFGPNVRFVAIVTDAPVEANDALQTDLAAACHGCTRCLDACHTDAFMAEIEVPVDGVTERFAVLDRKRCDWAKRYSLLAEEGTQYLGWDLTVPPPEVITPEALASALAQQPAIPKYRPCNFEACVLACPLAREQAALALP